MGPATAFRPLSAARVGRPGWAAARNWCSGLWLTWAAARPAPASTPRAGAFASQPVTLCPPGARPRGPGPTPLPLRAFCWSDSEIGVSGGVPASGRPASCCANTLPESIKLRIVFQHRGFLSLVIKPFCPHPGCHLLPVGGLGALVLEPEAVARSGHRPGQALSWLFPCGNLVSRLDAAALCPEGEASPGRRQGGRRLLCPGLPPQTAASSMASNVRPLFPHSSGGHESQTRVWAGPRTPGSVGEAASCRSPLPGGPGFCGLWRHLSGLRPRPHATSFPGLSDLLPLSQGLWSLGLVSTLSPE